MDSEQSPNSTSPELLRKVHRRQFLGLLAGAGAAMLRIGHGAEGQEVDVEELKSTATSLRNMRDELSAFDLRVGEYATSHPTEKVPLSKYEDYLNEVKQFNELAERFRKIVQRTGVPKEMIETLRVEVFTPQHVR